MDGLAGSLAASEQTGLMKPEPPLPETTVPSRRVLLFQLAGGAYALPLSSVGGLADCAGLRPVPGAPPALLGLTPWRGMLLAVVDLARLLEDLPSERRPCLVRLAPPRQQIALHVPASVRIVAATELTPAGGADADAPASGRILADGLEAELLDPGRLLCKLGAQIEQRPVASAGDRRPPS